MSKPYLIIITGHPGTGKTRLGRELSAALEVPLFSKDAIKERLFDTLGAHDQTWSRQVSGAAHRITDYVLDEELRTGHAAIIESNFKPEYDNARFEVLKETYHMPIIQILCWADGEVIFERFMERQRSSERHAGHVIDISPEEIRASFVGGRLPTLSIADETIEVDTTDFTRVDYAQIATDVRTILTKASVITLS